MCVPVFCPTTAGLLQAVDADTAVASLLAFLEPHVASSRGIRLLLGVDSGATNTRLLVQCSDVGTGKVAEWSERVHLRSTRVLLSLLTRLNDVLVTLGVSSRGCAVATAGPITAGTCTIANFGAWFGGVYHLCHDSVLCGCGHSRACQHAHLSHHRVVMGAG